MSPAMYFGMMLLVSGVIPLALCGIAAWLHRSGPLITGAILTLSSLFLMWDEIISHEFGFRPEIGFAMSAVFLFTSFFGMISGGTYLLALPAQPLVHPAGNPNPVAASTFRISRG